MSEYRSQGLQIFAAGDTSQQHHRTLGAHITDQLPGAASPRRTIDPTRDANRLALECPQFRRANQHVVRYEPQVRGDDENPRASAGRAREGLRIGEFAAKIESAQKAEYLRERDTLAAQTFGQFQRAVFPE